MLLLINLNTVHGLTFHISCTNQHSILCTEIQDLLKWLEFVPINSLGLDIINWKSDSNEN